MEVQAEGKRKEIQRIVEKNREEAGISLGGGGLFSSIFMSLNKKAREEERIAALGSMAIEIVAKEKNLWWSNIFGTKVKNGSSSEESNKKSIIVKEDGTVSTPPVDYFEDPDLLQNRPWAQRALVLVGGVVFNIILAFSLYFGELTVGSGLPRPAFEQGAVVSTVPRANSASVGLLGRGDIILSFNGKSLRCAKTCTAWCLFFFSCCVVLCCEMHCGLQSFF